MSHRRRSREGGGGASLLQFVWDRFFSHLPSTLRYLCISPSPPSRPDITRNRRASYEPTCHFWNDWTVSYQIILFLRKLHRLCKRTGQRSNTARNRKIRDGKVTVASSPNLVILFPTVTELFTKLRQRERERERVSE